MTANPEEKRPFGSKQRRSAARLAAVQAIYQMELSGTPVETAIKDLLQGRLPKEGANLARPDSELFTALVKGVAERKADLDGMVDQGLAADWPADRLEVLARAILRAGAFELIGRADIPARVSVSEYVDIAHAFYSGAEPGMINAVLDRIARVARPGEMKN